MRHRRSQPPRRWNLRFSWAHVAIAVVLMTWGAYAWTRDMRGTSGSPRGRDADLYAAVVTRMQAGMPYYQAANIELVERGYATAPVFNWRMPTLARIEASLPSLGWMIPPLTLLVLCASLAFRLMADSETRRMTASVSVLTMFAVWSREIVLHHEVVAGILVLASVAFWAAGRWPASVIAAAIAVLIREHAALYVVAMGALALRDHRRAEATAWAGVLVIFGVFYLWHVSQVLPLITPDALRNRWIVVGGWPTALAMARAQPVLLAAPTWLAVVVVPLLWLGLSAWRTDVGKRVWLIVSLYLIFFMVAGRPDNWYWGFLIAPILPLGLLGFVGDGNATRSVPATPVGDASSSR